MTDSLFHRLVVHLSTTDRDISMDSLTHLGDQSAVLQVLTNHPEIFHNSSGSCYSLMTYSTSIPSILATYLTLSVNVTRSPNQKLKPTLQKPSMMIKSKSTHFSFIPSTLASNTNQLVIILPDGSSYQVPCTFHLLSYAGGTLLAEVRFAVNSCRQLMCMVTNLSMEVISTTGEVKCLTSSDESKHSHIPVWNGPDERKTRKSRVLIRSDRVGRNKQVVGVVQVVQEQLLVFQVWELMLKCNKWECRVEEIVKRLGSEEAANQERVLAMLDQYRAMFTETGGNIALLPPSHSYWSQVLLLCSNITPATVLDQVPLSPVQLGVTFGSSTVVLRHLQGMVLPCDKMEDNSFKVRFRFSEVGDGLLVRLNNSKLRVPPEGKVIPLTMVIQTNKLKVMAVGTLGSWNEFKVNWPKGGINCYMENDLADDLVDLLRDDAPILSRTVDDNDIVTLEEETQLQAVIDSLGVDQCEEVPTRKIAAFSYFHDRAVDAGLISPGQSGVVTVQQFLDSAQAACNQPATDSQKAFLCVDLSFIAGLLHHGYRLEAQALLGLYKQINGYQTSWALGAAFDMIG